MGLGGSLLKRSKNTEPLPSWEHNNLSEYSGLKGPGGSPGSEKTEEKSLLSPDPTPTRLNCWCYTAKKQVKIKGVPKDEERTDIILVKDCEEKNCPQKYSAYCLIGKIRNGKTR